MKSPVWRWGPHSYEGSPPDFQGIGLTMSIFVSDLYQSPAGSPPGFQVVKEPRAPRCPPPMATARVPQGAGYGGPTIG